MTFSVVLLHTGNTLTRQSRSLAKLTSLWTMPLLRSSQWTHLQRFKGMQLSQQRSFTHLGTNQRGLSGVIVSMRAWYLAWEHEVPQCLLEYQWPSLFGEVLGRAMNLIIDILICNCISGCQWLLKTAACTHLPKKSWDPYLHNELPILLFVTLCCSKSS